MIKKIYLYAFTISFANTSFAQREQLNSAQPNSDLIGDYIQAIDDEDDLSEDVIKLAQAPAEGAATAVEGSTATTPASPSTANPSASPSTQPATTPSTSAPKKIIKKKKKSDVATDPSAGATTMGLGHGLQESGLPYKANADLSLTYYSSTQEKKYTDRAFKLTHSEIGVTLKYLLVLGSLEVGPIIGFQSSTSKSPNSEKPTVNDVYKISTTKFGLGTAFNIGNIHQNKMVPYIGMDILKNSSKTTFSVEESTSSSVTTLSTLDLAFEFGIKYFMGGHFALKPFFSYTKTLSGEDKNETTGADLQIASVTGSAMKMGLGIATYF